VISKHEILAARRRVRERRKRRELRQDILDAEMEAVQSYVREVVLLTQPAASNRVH